jgi:SAM-dependent methyltransferase
MPEVDLMKSYPKTSREDLITIRRQVSEADRARAQQFGEEYFDGPRHLGLGGYYYNKKYFGPVVQDMIQFYSLKRDSRILDVGCGKGFMMKDFMEALPGSSVYGIDISRYCHENSLIEVKSNILLGSCERLPFPDNHFDLVISIATIHNVDIEGVKKSLREIVRVSRGNNYYIKVNGYRNDQERQNLEDWNLVAKTILHVEQWEQLFEETGYQGQYSFFST